MVYMSVHYVVSHMLNIWKYWSLSLHGITNEIRSLPWILQLMVRFNLESRLYFTSEIFYTLPFFFFFWLLIYIFKRRKLPSWCFTAFWKSLNVEFWTILLAHFLFLNFQESCWRCSSRCACEFFESRKKFTQVGPWRYSEDSCCWGGCSWRGRWRWNACSWGCWPLGMLLTYSWSIYWTVYYSPFLFQKINLKKLLLLYFMRTAISHS